MQITYCWLQKTISERRKLQIALTFWHVMIFILQNNKWWLIFISYVISRHQYIFFNLTSKVCQIKLWWIDSHCQLVATCQKLRCSLFSGVGLMLIPTNSVYLLVIISNAPDKFLYYTGPNFNYFDHNNDKVWKK